MYFNLWVQRANYFDKLILDSLHSIEYLNIFITSQATISLLALRLRDVRVRAVNLITQIVEINNF